MRHRCGLILLAAAAVNVDAGPVRAQDVEARLTRVGLFSGGVPLLRADAWSFAEVELRYRGAEPFDGELRLDQRDRDGDIVTYRLPVALAPGADWRPYQVYFVPQAIAPGESVRVRLHDASGEQVILKDDKGLKTRELLGPPAVGLRADDLLVVDLTHPARLTHVAMLDMDLRRLADRVNPRKVRSLTPRELPTQWHGLDAVDALVWDDADPSDLTLQQTTALVDWVRNGGRLLITASKNWQALAASPLADALPVTLNGLSQRNEAQEFLDLVGNEEYEGRLDRLYLKQGLSRCKMSPRPGAIPIPAECPNQQIAYRRYLGRGMIVFVGASLNELLPPPGNLRRIAMDVDADRDRFDADDPFLGTACERIVARRLLGLPGVHKQEQNLLFMVTDLFGFLRSSIAFESVGTKFLIFAIVFALAYTLVATFGSFWYLRRRGWEHHCWTAFGVVSIAGSVVGTGMVGLLRGVTTRLWQTTVIDAEAGVDYGYARCLFGVRTPNHTRLDLRLPVDGNADDPTGAGRRSDSMDASGALNAVPEAEGANVIEAQFAAAARYESLLGGRSLTDVPVRATLKEIEGRWHGPLNGTLEGRLVIRRSPRRFDRGDRENPESTLRFDFAEGSYIRNNLGVGLYDCYLLETSEEIAGETQNVLANCFFLGDLPTKGPESQLDATALRQKLLMESNLRTDGPAKPIRRLPLLTDALKDWSGALRSMISLSGGLAVPTVRLSGDEEYPAVLMLSFFNLMRPDANQRMSFKRTHGRPLDCSHRLTRTTALVIGRTDEPPPAVLEVNRTKLFPGKSSTIYRFTLPVERR